MMKKLGLGVLVIVLLLNLLGCGDKTETKMTRLELAANKTEIQADNVDTVVFTIKGYDQNNKEINTTVNLYKDGIAFTGTSFKSSVIESCKFTAKSGSITSNEITVKANEPQKLTSIVLTTDKTTIAADNTDTATFTVKGYDQNNVEMTADIKVYKNGVEIAGTTFNTATTGSYKFTAKSGEVTSNEITVTANVVVQNVSYSMAQKMLGQWEITYKLSTTTYKEWITFSSIKEDVTTPGEYIASGKLTKTYDDDNRITNSENIDAIAYYYSDDSTMNIMWLDSSGYGSFFSFNLGASNAISGEYYLLMNGELSSGYAHAFTGIKTSTNYNTAIERSVGVKKVENTENENMNKIKEEKIERLNDSNNIIKNEENRAKEQILKKMKENYND